MSNNWEKKWIEDIDFLKSKLINNHKNLFFTTTREEFEEKIETLKSIINNLDYDEMKVELSRIVASIKDAHTSIEFPVNKYLPFKFYYFNDGIYITKVTKGFEKILYRKVTKIEDMPIDEVIKELSQIISYENEYFLKAQSVKYLQGADILYGLLICNNIDKINITLEDEVVEIKTIAPKDLLYLENIKIPLYAKKCADNYWYEYIKDEETLYIKYNSCKDNGDVSIKNNIVETINFIEKNNVNKITIDLRNNLGGNSTLLRPLIEYIKSNKKINQRENLKVIIGRETFSSALINAYEFKFETNAILTGEPSGGKPNCYGEILRFTLPNSKFRVSYSTKYYKIIEDDSILALYPDEFQEEKIEEYLMYL